MNGARSWWFLAGKQRKNFSIQLLNQSFAKCTKYTHFSLNTTVIKINLCSKIVTLLVLDFFCQFAANSICHIFLVQIEWNDQSKKEQISSLNLPVGLDDSKQKSLQHVKNTFLCTIHEWDSKGNCQLDILLKPLANISDLFLCLKVNWNCIPLSHMESKRLPFWRCKDFVWFLWSVYPEKHTVDTFWLGTNRFWNILLKDETICVSEIINYPCGWKFAVY